MDPIDKAMLVKYHAGFAGSYHLMVGIEGNRNNCIRVYETAIGSRLMVEITKDGPVVYQIHDRNLMAFDG